MNRFPFADEIRAVLFDAGNTLLCIDHARLCEALGAVGLATSPAAVRAAEMRTRPRLDPVLAAAARRESREIVETAADLFLAELGCEADGIDAAKDAFVAAWPTLWKHVPLDARPTLDALRGRGYRLGVVSNSTGQARSLLAQAALLDAFEFVLDSHEVGVEKPDPRIFSMAAERLALPPHCCVHVGDLYSVDVVGSRAAGMSAVLLDPLGVWTDVDVPKIARLEELTTRLP